MTTFLWILVSGTLTSLIALVGSVTLLLSEKAMARLVLPLVALAAGSLIGGAFFLLGGLLTYALSLAVDVSYLIPLAAGNFLYIGAADLVPEVNRHPNCARAC